MSTEMIDDNYRRIRAKNGEIVSGILGGMPVVIKDHTNRDGLSSVWIGGVGPKLIQMDANLNPQDVIAHFGRDALSIASIIVS